MLLAWRTKRTANVPERQVFFSIEVAELLVANLTPGRDWFSWHLAGRRFFPIHAKWSSPQG